ncbi:MAG: radical SAM protein [Desulfovibrionaceae bacterium]|nr:radical SAM protein [Desulfovibrionaceae bacterium]
MKQKSDIDIILVKPGSQKRIYGRLSDFALTAIEPPLYAALLAAYLRQKGFSVALLDAEAEGLDYAQTAARMSEAEPLLAAVVVSGTNPSASTMNMDGAEAILGHYRELRPRAAGLLMGLHPSALPERSTRETTADYVCQGEGFYTLPPLLEALKAGETGPAIPGLWRRDEEGNPVSNPRPPAFEDLDALPMAAWDLLPMKTYRAHNWHCFGRITEREPYAVVHTSLGCPFNCSFCCINSLYGRRGIRMRSNQAVVDELEHLVSTYGVRNVKILDEMFALKEDRVVELCRLISERGLDLNIWAYARVNTITEPMLPSLRRAGIGWLAYGFESGSKRILAEVSKGYDPDAVSRVVDKTFAHGIHICANFIFGLPGDDYESMNQTLELMLDINAEWANIYSAMAYPGSRLYDQALEQGWPLPETWSGYSQYSYDCLPLPTGRLSGGQVLAFRDYAFNTYFRSPRYQSMIAAKFGAQTADYVRGMAAHDLDRKHAGY